MTMRVILLGAPGSGKGTQAARLAQRTQVQRISTGDIIREEIAQKTDLGVQVEELVKSGRLVSDRLVLNVVFNRLDQPSCQAGFVLDGFPRTVDQAQGLATYLEKKSLTINKVFYLEVHQDILLQRLAARRYCSGCQMVYNLLTNPPQGDSVCDQCGGKLVSRGDDEPITVKKRLVVYEELTSPLIAHYKAIGSLVVVDGACNAETISEELLKNLGNH